MENIIVLKQMKINDFYKNRSDDIESNSSSNSIIILVVDIFSSNFDYQNRLQVVGLNVKRGESKIYNNSSVQIERNDFQLYPKKITNFIFVLT